MAKERALESRIALVTGANRGIGLEVARQLLERKFSVILGSRDFERGEQAARVLGGGPNLKPIQLDVTDAASVRMAAETVGELYGRLDVLVNNAGGNYDLHQTASQADLDYVRETLNMNLIGPWIVAQAFLPLLRKGKSPRLVNVSSGAGSFGLSQNGIPSGEGTVSAYAASKAGLNALTVKLAAELKQAGIQVNAVCPGFTATKPGMKERGARPIAEGAASVVWVVLLPDGGPTGKFFRDGKELPW
jgi:NAD(P)-dependent dehydrogenase (short-subunit alcohol dehydrogenase family)